MTQPSIPWGNILRGSIICRSKIGFHLRQTTRSFYKWHAALFPNKMSSILRQGKVKVEANMFLNDWWCSRRRKIRRIKLNKGNNLTLFFNTKTFYTHDSWWNICYLWFPLFLLYKHVINFYFVHSYNLLVLFLHTLRKQLF